MINESLAPDDQAPTLLHSWGHVNRPCPRGYRQAFSLARLRQGGARGFGLISPITGQHRHLHQQEGAMLCTVPPTYQFPMPPRAALSLLGQIAAPLQVLWIQSHILAGLQQQHHWGHTIIDPALAIRAFQHGLKAYAFNTPSQFLPREIQLCIEGTDELHSIKIASPITVGQLMTAEKTLAGCGHYVIVTHILSICSILDSSIISTSRSANRHDLIHLDHHSQGEATTISRNNLVTA